MLSKRAAACVCALAFAALVASCSSGGGKQSATPSTGRLTPSVRPSSTTTLPRAPVRLGPCPKFDPNESRVPFNEGVRGLAKQFVPLSATAVRVCSYQYLPNGSTAVTSGAPALSVAQLEDETNRLERYPVGSDAGGGCVASPRGLFVTFANATQRSSVAFEEGCAAPPSNRVLIAHATAKWLADIENFTDVSLTADDITGTWRPVSIAGYHGPLHSPPLAVAPEIAFDGTSKWTGSDGCNYTSGTYRLGARNAIHLTDIGTKRRCVRTAPPDPLQRAARVELRDDRLQLFGPAGHELATYELYDLLTSRPL